MTMRKMKLNLIALTLFSLLLILSAPKAWADDERQLALMPATSAEDTALIYFSLRQVDPNFMEMAVQNMPAENNVNTIQKEVNRLQDRYAKCSPDRDYIVIQDVVPFGAQQINGQNIFVLDEFNPEFFVPVYFQKHNLMLVVKDIEDFGTIPMSEAALTTFFKGYDQQPYLSYTLHLRAQKTNGQSIKLEDDKDYNIVMTDIAYLAFFNRHGEVFWSYKASWYGQTTENELKALYHKENLLTTPELNRVEEEIKTRYKTP